MANINVTGNGTFSANNFTVPANDTSVSFHSADAACTICFGNSQTFGTNSLNLGKGGNPTSLTIANRVDTTFTVNASGYTCPTGGQLTDDTTYTIDMSSGQK